jgi:hypothetical protein
MALLRDWVWLLAHDERTMRLLIDARALNIGLLGAAVTDLLMAGHLRVEHEQLVCHRETTPIDDPIQRQLLDALRRERAPYLEGVLRAARTGGGGADAYNPYGDLYSRIWQRLVETNVLVLHRGRRRNRRPQFSERHTLGYHRGDFNHHLVLYPREANAKMECLGALLWGLNLHEKLSMPFNPTEAGGYLREIVSAIPQRAGDGSPLAAVPLIAASIRHTVGDLATAAF